jgi:hypothetical protein
MVGLISNAVPLLPPQAEESKRPPSIKCSFYRGIIESILTSCITVWYESCTASNRKTLQRTEKAAGWIISVLLPFLLDIYGTCLTRKATSIEGDPSNPSHSLFGLLRSGKRYRSLCAGSTRLGNSFYQQAVRKLNSLPSLPTES